MLGEEDAQEIHRRVHYVAEALDLTPEERDQVAANLVALPLAGRVCSLLQLSGDAVKPTPHLAALREQLEAHAGEDGWGLIVIDPQARFAGVEVETNNSLATRFVQECEALTRTPGGPTVLVVAHSSKIARRAGTADSRGVTGLTDGFRWHATLTSKSADAVEFEAQKNNYGRPSAPVRLRRRRGGVLLAETEAEREADDQAEDERTNARVDALVKTVVAHLREVGRVGPREALAKATRGRITEARKAVDLAVERGLIQSEREGRRDVYALTEVGDLLG